MRSYTPRAGEAEEKSRSYQILEAQRKPTDLGLRTLAGGGCGWGGSQPHSKTLGGLEQDSC